MTDRNLYGWFDNSIGGGVTGAVGIVADVYRVPHSGSPTLIIVSGTVTEVGGGLYKHLLTNFDFLTYDALVIFKVPTGTMSKFQVPALRWDGAEAHGTGSFGVGSGSGAVSTVVTINVSGLPRDGVEVWVTTDSAGNNIIASGVTDALGQVTFMLDAGSYYVFKQLAGVNFTNPETMVVP